VTAGQFFKRVMDLYRWLAVKPSGFTTIMTTEETIQPKISEPVFNYAHGRLLMPGTRYWPMRMWKSPWNLPTYRRGAAVLAGIISGAAAAAWLLGEIPPRIAPFYSMAESYALSHGVNPFLTQLAWTFIKAALLLAVPLVNALFAVWWERKISAHIQSRMGPMYVGRWHGCLQTIADGIKLFLKEDVVPECADKIVHLLAPVVVIIPAILAFAPVPFGRELVYADIDIGTIYVFAVGGVSVMGVIMAGWSSGNKFSLLGGLRAAAQLVSYELPRTFSVIPVIMLAGTLNISAIAGFQAGYWGGILPRWFIFYPVVGQVAFIVFLIASVAETNRVPFDIPEAESELVAGFNTEYSGMKFALFFLSEFAYVLLSSLLMAAFFFGGGEPPLPFLGFLPSWAWFLAKALVIMFCFLWFRWTFPRFRVDRLMDFNWKFLLPVSLLNIAAAGILIWFLS